MSFAKKHDVKSSINKWLKRYRSKIERSKSKRNCQKLKIDPFRDDLEPESYSRYNGYES